MRDNRKGKISAMGAGVLAESLPRSDNRFQAGGMVRFVTTRIGGARAGHLENGLRNEKQGWMGVSSVGRAGAARGGLEGGWGLTPG